MKIEINEKYTKTYSNEKNLDKAIADFSDLNYLVVWTKSGRCTAVFTNTQENGCVGVIAAKGVHGYWLSYDKQRKIGIFRTVYN